MRRRRLTEGLGVAALLVVAGLLYTRGLDAAANYDEGVYLASLDALVHGQSLGTDVYASQPPGFYVLLRAVSLLPGDGVAWIRGGFILLALLGLLAAYAIGRKVAGIPGGLGAAALLAVTSPYPVQAARIQADTASVALALCAVAVLMYAGRSAWRSAGAGALAGAALSVKLLAFPVAAPIAVLLVARRSWRAAGALAVGAAAVWIALVGVYMGAMSDLWRSAVTDHRRAHGHGPSIADNADRILLHPLDWRTAAGVLVPVGLVCAVVFLRRVDTLALGAWIVASAAFLVYQQPLFDHHIVLLTTVLAVPAGAGLGAAVTRVPMPARYAVAGVVALAILAGLAQEERRLARQGGELSSVMWAADEIQARTSPNELVGTDLPIVAYLADRREPGQLVDSSYVRLGTGSLTDAEILAALDRTAVRAVAVGRIYAERPGLVRALHARYPTRLERDGVTLYLRPRA